MHAILEKHAKPKVEVTPAAADALPTEPSPAAEGSGSATAGAALKWERITDWYMRSRCGRYRCRKYIPGEVRVGEHNDPPKYQLEKLVESLWFYRFGPPFDSWDEARKAAEADARK